MKRRKKLQPGEKRTRRKKYPKEPKVSLKELKKQIKKNMRYQLNLKMKINYPK